MRPLGNVLSFNQLNEMEVNNQITFCSYNINHYDDTKDAHHDDSPSALELLFESCTFLILQETWLAEE